MNINNDQTVTNKAQCCVDFCKTSFKVADQEVVNSYRCDQKPFTTSDMWYIQKSKKWFFKRRTLGF